MIRVTIRNEVGIHSIQGGSKNGSHTYPGYPAMKIFTPLDKELPYFVALTNLGATSTDGPIFMK